MSCEDCEKVQESGEMRGCYVRIQNANVQIIGCDKHLKELLNQLSSIPEKVKIRHTHEPYTCGHQGTPVIIDDNEMSMTAYLDWLEESDKCWNCWCDDQKNK